MPAPGSTCGSAWSGECSSTVVARLPVVPRSARRWIVVWDAAPSCARCATSIGTSSRHTGPTRTGGVARPHPVQVQRAGTGSSRCATPRVCWPASRIEGGLPWAPEPCWSRASSCPTSRGPHRCGQHWHRSWPRPRRWSSAPVRMAFAPVYGSRSICSVARSIAPLDAPADRVKTLICERRSG